MRTMYKTTILFLMPALLLASLTTRAQATERPGLATGDPAPGIGELQWVKGPPVTGFKRGHVYVVELTSIECPICRESMPDLKELVKKYKGKVTFMAVYLEKNNAFETTTPSYAQKVKEYVTALNNPYSVAVDDSRGSIFGRWMKPTALIGVPQVYVVGKDGNIAWIGHPLELERVLEQMKNGTFAPRTEYDRQSMWKEQINKFYVYRRNGKWDNAIHLLDELLEVYPEKRYFLLPKKYETLLMHNEEKAYALGQNLLKEKHNYHIWAGMIRIRPLNKEDELAPRYYDLRAAFAQKAIKLTDDKLQIGDNLRVRAYVYFKRGNYTRAVEVQQKAIDILASRDPRDHYGKGSRHIKILKKYRDKMQSNAVNNPNSRKNENK